MTTERFFEKCSWCKGRKGRRTWEWDKWWDIHVIDWAEHLDSRPPLPEYIVCPECHGTGERPLKENAEVQELVSLIQWIIGQKSCELENRVRAMNNDDVMCRGMV